MLLACIIGFIGGVCVSVYETHQCVVEAKRTRKADLKEAKSLGEKGYDFYVGGVRVDYKNVYLEDYSFEINRKEHKIILH